MHGRGTLLLCALATSLLTGCAEQPSNPPAVTSTSTTPQTPSVALADNEEKPPSPPAVTATSTEPQTPPDEECLQFAELLEQTVASGAGAELEALIHWDTITEKATAGIDGGENFQDGLRKGFSSLRSGFSAQIVDPVVNGGSYRFLRLHTLDGEKRVLFRLLHNGGGVNYHDLVLARLPDGEIRSVDIYVYLSGERISKTLRRGILPLAAEASKGFLAKLTQEENDYVKHIDTIRRMGEAQRAGHSREVLTLFSTRLPASLKKDKTLLLLRLIAAAQVSEEAYGEAMDEYVATFPGDPSLDLVLIDKYFLEGQYDKSLASIDRLDAALGGDPYLDCLRANAKWLQGDMEAARRFATRSIEADATILNAYGALLNVSLSEKDFDETTRLLWLLEETFFMEFDDLTQDPAYAEYVQSPQYQEWLASRRPEPE